MGMGHSGRAEGVEEAAGCELGAATAEASAPYLTKRYKTIMKEG